MSDNEILAKWSDLKSLVESLEHDVAKNAKGTAAAGVRVRKGLRDLKTKAGELVKLTLTLDKTKKKDWNTPNWLLFEMGYILYVYPIFIE